MTKALSIALERAARERPRRCSLRHLLAAAVILACAKPTASVQGVEVSVTGVERLELWQGSWAPPDHEFLVIRVNVDAREKADAVTLAPLRLLGARGEVGTSATRELTLSGGSEHEPELGFAVPKGSKPEVVVVGEATLSLGFLDLP